jgi:hypothetical protein
MDWYSAEKYSKDSFNERIILDVHRIFLTEMQGRLDFSLLNLQISRCFFSFYCSAKNQEKAWIILHKSFLQNKKHIDVYLELYIKYRCIKPLLHTFFNAADTCTSTDRSESADHQAEFFPKTPTLSLSEWISQLSELKHRAKYIDYV